MRLLQLFLLSVTAVPAMSHETGAVHFHGLGVAAVVLMALAVTLSVYYLRRRS